MIKDLKRYERFDEEEHDEENPQVGRLNAGLSHWLRPLRWAHIQALNGRHFNPEEYTDSGLGRLPTGRCCPTTGLSLAQAWTSKLTLLHCWLRLLA